MDKGLMPIKSNVDGMTMEIECIDVRSIVVSSSSSSSIEFCKIMYQTDYGKFDRYYVQKINHHPVLGRIMSAEKTLLIEVVKD